MALKWRFCLVAILASAVIGGLVPHGALSGTESGLRLFAGPFSAELSLLA